MFTVERKYFHIYSCNICNNKCKYLILVILITILLLFFSYYITLADSFYVYYYSLKVTSLKIDSYASIILCSI